MKILQKENKILRHVAKPVPVKDIASSKIQKTIKDLKNTMHPIYDAVAIAAPQIGASLRIFVVSGKVFARERQIDTKEHGGDAEETRNNDKKKPREPVSQKPDLVCINPEVVKQSREKENMEEGCLSVRWLYGYVKRSKKVTLRAYDENGKRFTRGASGLLAQIFQHETDHLNGMLFIDKATGLREIPPLPKKETAV